MRRTRWSREETEIVVNETMRTIYPPPPPTPPPGILTRAMSRLKRLIR